VSGGVSGRGGGGVSGPYGGVLIFISQRMSYECAFMPMLVKRFTMARESDILV